MDEDIAAYLEAQVDNKDRAIAEKPVVDDAAVEERSEERRRDRRSSSRDRRRHRSRSRSGDARKRRSRSRSYDRDGRRRSDDRDRDRNRDRDRDRGRDRDRERDRERDSGRRDEGPSKAAAPETAGPAASTAPTKSQFEINQELANLRRLKEMEDLTKDQRTIFVGQLTVKVSESHLKSFFGQIGEVRGVIMVRDKITGKHKGFAYVEMGDLDAIPNCLLLNNIVPDFQKFPILVKASEAEKNFVAKKETPLYDPVGDSRLYIGNLHMNVTEGELRTVLSQYGQVDMVSIHRDELGVSKGYSFCKFAFPDHASQAMSKLSGFELMGKPLKVGYITDHASSASTAASGHGSGNWKLDDDDGSGLQMNAQSRAMLMNKLGQAAGMQMPKPVAPPTAGFGAPLITGAPTRCFKIRNMFDPATETEPNWDMDVKEDVTEECAKFGAVEHCYVESKKPGGIVFVRFANVDSSREAANSLNGRFFAGRQITIEYIDPAKYSTLF